MKRLRIQRQRQNFDRTWGLWVVTAGVLALMFIPVAVTILFSLNSANSLIVFHHLSFTWYRVLLHDGATLASLRVSIELALLSALLATVFGTLLAIGWQRAARRYAAATSGTVFLRLVAPETATASSLLLLFTQLKVTLSFWTILAGHVALTIAFVAVIVRSRLGAMNAELEYAAQDLGASPLQAMRLVVLPTLRPSILSGALLAFVLSFDDFVTTYFTSGVGTQPLPLRIYSMLRFGISPEANAAGVMMLVIVALVLSVAAVAALTISSKRTTRTVVA